MDTMFRLVTGLAGRPAGKAIPLAFSASLKIKVNLAIRSRFCSEELMLDGTRYSILASLSQGLGPSIPSFAHGGQNSTTCSSRT